MGKKINEKRKLNAAAHTVYRFEVFVLLLRFAPKAVLPDILLPLSFVPSTTFPFKAKTYVKEWLPSSPSLCLSYSRKTRQTTAHMFKLSIRTLMPDKKLSMKSPFLRCDPRIHNREISYVIHVRLRLFNFERLKYQSTAVSKAFERPLNQLPSQCVPLQRHGEHLWASIQLSIESCWVAKA